MTALFFSYFLSKDIQPSLSIINETIIYTGLEKHIFSTEIVIIFLPILLSICFGCSREPSH